MKPGELSLQNKLFRWQWSGFPGMMVVVIKWSGF